LLAKRLVIFFAMLLVILAIANIGVAFVAARLAKDTTTQNNVLVVKDSGQVVATKNHADVYATQTNINTERRAQAMGGALQRLHLRLLVAPMLKTCIKNVVLWMEPRSS
jgi:hypothetical protein